MTGNSRNLIDNSRKRNELHIESGGLFCDSLKLLVFGFVECNSTVDVVMAKLQHAVDQTCEHGKPEVGPKRRCGKLQPGLRGS